MFHQLHWDNLLPDTFQPDYANMSGLSSFQLAMRLQRWDVAKLLISLGAVPSCYDLFTASVCGELELVKTMVGMGLDVNKVVCNGQSALQISLTVLASIHSAAPEKR